MGFCWALVSTDWSGGMDIGVLAVGAGVAAGLAAVYGNRAGATCATTIVWSAASFLLTFAVGLAVVWVFYAGPLSFNLGPGDGAGLD